MKATAVVITLLLCVTSVGFVRELNTALGKGLRSIGCIPATQRLDYFRPRALLKTYMWTFCAA